MCQGSKILRATQKQSPAQNNPMPAVGYISDPGEIIKASWSILQHDGVASFKLAETSPLPPAVSPKDLPGSRTEVFNVRKIKRVGHHPL
jgi:hypothetical protein